MGKFWGLWCQRGDLNPRPPAYETSALNQLSYLDKNAYYKGILLKIC